MLFKKTKKTQSQMAWVISVEMGLGHARAAYPLRDIAYNGIVLSGSKISSSKKEYKLWKRLKKIYYFFSNAEQIPIIGKYIFNLLVKSEEISPYYPKRDLSKPNWGINYLEKLIDKKGLCSDIIKKISHPKLPIINTYFASAIAIDKKKKNIKNNYCMVCDSDINRAWVPGNPFNSNIKYMVPSEHAKRRLLLYGIKEKNIFFTGFPLPKENIGSENKLEILKKDLLARLLRLDPDNKFFNLYEHSLCHFFGKKFIPKLRPDYFTLMFAVGGAGAQFNMAKKIVTSLKKKIKQKKIRFILSAGIHKYIYNDFNNHIKSLTLSSYMGKEIKIIYDPKLFNYLDKFNKILHETDILWTKPSELSFYCGLGIPILIAPPIGTHEIYNRKWLRNIHAGVIPDGAIKHCDEWLFHIRKKGRFAEAAWQGYRQAVTLGTYKIERLISTGEI